MKSKKQLEVALSKLTNIKSPKVDLEQYITPSDIASEVLWLAYMNNEIKNRVIADLGCGNGILGIGALLLGAKKVFFIDSDRNSLLIAKSNLANLNLKNAALSNINIPEYKEKVDLVIQNPPFGVQNTHSDRNFLIKAMENSNKVYSFHKLESENFIKALSRDYNFRIKSILKFKFPLKKTQEFHAKKVHYVDVGCFILEKWVRNL